MRVVLTETVTSLIGEARRLEICVGDATAASVHEKLDLLALSCFRNAYIPTPGTIVRSLRDKGVDVGAWAANPARDYRDQWQTWISTPLSDDEPFGRLVCFEHELEHGDTTIEPSAVVGNVFRAVTDFIQETASGELGVFRIPLLSTGDQGADKSAMLNALLHAAYTHLRGSLPVHRVQIVLHDKAPELHSLLIEAGRALENVRAEWAASRLVHPPEFDYFLSYRRTEREVAGEIMHHLKSRVPGVRIFLDERSLAKGVCWKPDLVCAIHNSRRAVCLITDSYAESRECVDEFHIALCISRNRPDFLRPLLRLRSRSLESLPPTIARVNLIDAACPPRSMDDLISDILAEAAP